jgi:transglutaminase-like putative cysteine protease
LRPGLVPARTVRRCALALLLALVGTIAPGARHPDALGQTPSPQPLTLPSDTAVAADAQLHVVDTPLDVSQLPPLQDVIDAEDAQVRAMPETDWEIPALVTELQLDPERAFEFVRDRIGFDPYQGELRGAQGTLAARSGNSLDRALLLAALLRQMLVPVRFAIVDLDDADAAAVLARSVEPPAAPLPSPAASLLPSLDVQALSDRAHRDYARLRTVLGDLIDSATSTADTPGLDAVRHHVWVQAGVGPEWVDMDPTLSDAMVGSPIEPATSTASDLPLSEQDTVTVRLVAETLVNGALTPSTILERSLDAPTASASRIFLYFQPSTSSLGGAITAALTGDVSWVPVLLIDRTTELGSAFQTGGFSTDAFGNTTETPELTALRLDIETAAPGSKAQTAERVLIDRVPPDLRPSSSVDAAQLLPLPEDDAGPFVFGAIHHIMVSTGGTDRRDFAIQRSWSAWMTGAVASDVAVAADFALMDQLWPIAVADQDLVVASESLIVPALDTPEFRSYIARPRVYLSSLGRDPQTGHDLALSTDLLLDSVELLPRETAPVADAMRERLWYGTLQTALETQVALRRAAMLDSAGRSLTGASLASGPLTVLGPTDVATLPVNTPPSLREALSSGWLAVVPTDPIPPAAWWIVKPETGETRSIVAPGLGGVLPVGPVSVAARTFASSYTHGTGPRLPPQRPPVRPPGGSGYRGASTCTAGDSTGYIALTSCISVPVSMARWMLFLEIAAICVFAYYMLR